MRAAIHSHKLILSLRISTHLQRTITQLAPAQRFLVLKGLIMLKFDYGFLCLKTFD